MKKTVLSFFLLLSFSYADISIEEKKLVQAIIPGSKVVKIDQTPMDGLYIVLLNNKKSLYVYPYKKLIFFGEILTSKGENLSTIMREHLLESESPNRITEILKKTSAIKKMEKISIPLKYNKGSKGYDFFVFTDPDCPFCRKLEGFFRESNISVQYMFNPLQKLHPHSFEKSQKLISSSEKIFELLHDIGLDKNISVSIDANSSASLDEMISIANEFGIGATPTILVYDNREKKIIDLIEGADIKKLKKYIKGDYAN